jgi:hypothetical protein
MVEGLLEAINSVIFVLTRVIAFALHSILDFFVFLSSFKSVASKNGYHKKEMASVALACTLTTNSLNKGSIWHVFPPPKSS